MKPLILAINIGSSSIKVTVFKLEIDQSLIQIANEYVANVSTIELGLTKIFAKLKQTIELSTEKMHCISHRFVHGGNKYADSIIIDAKVLKELEQLQGLAPLHNPYCLMGINICRKLYPEVINIAVFDTAFHQSMPDHAATYALPINLINKYQIRRYGFHGIAHAALWNAYSKTKSAKVTDKIITIHLGSGCSITAIKAGKVLDTSMGFTPLEGLVMATRSGDIDPSLIQFIAEQEKITIAEVLTILNKQSGLLGLSGTAKMQELININTREAKIAIEVFCYRVVKYLGAYLAVLSGVEAIIFSGGIGENSPEIRAKILQSFAWLGYMVDFELNQQIKNLVLGNSKSIHAKNSKAAILVIAVDENQYIAAAAVEKLNSNLKE